MAALTVTQAILDIASIPDARLSAMLLGLTIQQAAATMRFVYQIRTGGQAIDNAGMVNYNIANQATTFSMTDVTMAVEFFDKMARSANGGGVSFLPLRLP